MEIAYYPVPLYISLIDQLVEGFIIWIKLILKALFIELHNETICIIGNNKHTVHCSKLLNFC